MLILILIPLILKIITIIMSKDDNGNKDGLPNYQYRETNKLKIIYIAEEKQSTWVILLAGFLIAKCFINTGIKWLIDLNNLCKTNYYSAGFCESIQKTENCEKTIDKTGNRVYNSITARAKGSAEKELFLWRDFL